MTDLGLRQAFAVTLFGCFMFLPMAAVEAMEAQEAVSAPGGLLDQFNSGEISEQELMEQSQGMAGFDGHCETDGRIGVFCRNRPLT